MNLEQMRKRLEDIQAKLQEYAALENYSEEDVKNIDELNGEFNSVKANIEAKEKVEAVLAVSNLSKRKTEPAPVENKVEVTNWSKKQKNGGFENFGEFLNSVKRASQGDMDERFRATHFERSGEDGGFLVPEEMMSTIAEKMGGDEALLPRTTSFDVSGNSLSLPTDELQPWTGGIEAYWTAEGRQIQESKHRFGEANWKLNKLAALVKVTDELLEDTTALESYVLGKAPGALDYKVNSAIISGSGAGQPKGILNSDFRVAVAKESGQAADTIVAENVIKMYSRMIPASRSRAVWYINAQAEEQLRLMKNDNGEYIYLAPGSQMNQSPYGLLMGRPVLPMLASMPQLGDEGDIIFADLSYYYTIKKVGGVKQAISSHLFFDQAINAYRFTFRLDGSCPFKSPVVTEFGNHEMSGIVTLADRA